MSFIWLPFTTFTARFEVEDPEKLPKKLFSSFRGAFGKALKKISCVARAYESCLECALNQTCAYGYLFETPRPKEADRLKGYPFIPHPFTFSPPFPYKKDKILNIKLTLIGKAIEYFPQVILSLDAMGKTGLGPQRVPLKLIDLIDEQSHRKLFEKGKVFLPKNMPPPEIPDTNRITIRFLTPTALKFSRKIITQKDLEFHILVRNALRRISALSYFHAQKPLDIDFKGVIASSEKITTVEKNLKFISFNRYSGRTKKVYLMKGFIGEAKFEGNLKEFLPILTLCSYVHIGKNTSFGFGKYEIFIWPQSPQALLQAFG